MKKIAAVFTTLLLSTIVSVASTPSTHFDLDAATIESEFAELENIEKFVENNGLTLEELAVERADLLENVELISETSTVFTTEEMPILGGFWWGCCLGIIGLALVYFITDNDREQVKNALIGCVISTLVVGLGGLFNIFGLF